MMTITSYQNPIVCGMYPDPSIVRVDDSFYLVNSTFEYYPGIALSKSKDLLNWTKLPSIAKNHSQADLRKAKSNEGIFAVCIRYHKGYFYVITTNFAEWKNFIIRGKLSDDKENIIWENSRVEVDFPGIDPDLYFEDDRAYVQFTGYLENGQKAIRQIEIDITTGQTLKQAEILSYGTGGRDVEGPHIIKKDGYYYLLLAEGGTGVGHMITMFRSKNIWGPYDESAPCNPLFTNRDRAEQPLQNIGHADLFQDQLGNWWLTCLGTRPASVGFVQYTNIGRETLLYPVDWSGDWPVINNGTPTQTVDMTAFPEHAKILSEQKATDFVDTFETTELNPEWISLRDSLASRIIFKNHTLTLTGSTEKLDGLGVPSFLAVRQTEHDEIFQIELNQDSKLNSGAFGLAVMINSNHYATLMIEKSEDSFAIYKHLKVLDIDVKEKIGELSELPKEISLTNTKESKIFTAKTNIEEITFSINAMHFSNEAIAALNTGDVQGIYVTGDAAMTINKASRRKLN
ncbi:glycoside hydrolase family 43 protein [Streptococcus equinus]|uniref:glycoside hydrolase family 43 protein n=1 Tax=Streptococcus equinus TaxID=1335 RepID=UPI0030B93069